MHKNPLKSPPTNRNGKNLLGFSLKLWKSVEFYPRKRFKLRLILTICHWYKFGNQSTFTMLLLQKLFETFCQEIEH